MPDLPGPITEGDMQDFCALTELLPPLFYRCSSAGLGAALTNIAEALMARENLSAVAVANMLLISLTGPTSEQGRALALDLVRRAGN